MDQKIRIALESQNPWWFGKPYATGTDRLSWFPDILRYLDTQEVLLLPGARRTGKSTLVYQIIRDLLGRGVAKEAILYMNLDEPLFQVHNDDPAFISGIIEDHLARQGSVGRFYLCIDEIQNYHHWVGTIKTLYDTKSHVKCILTGSTSSLLRREISTRLSGRYFACTVYPLSFSEYLSFQGLQHPTRIERRQRFTPYLQYGGFPRVVCEEQDDVKGAILKNYYETIYLKDIIFPNDIRHNTEIVDLLWYLLSNIGNLHSYNRIADTLHLATTTVKEYIGYAEEAFLLYPVMKYDPSVRKQLVNPRKIYCVDTGLANAVAFAFSENRGRLLENLVFITLKRVYDDIYYFKSSYECDFLVKSGRTIEQAIQVSVSLSDPAVRKREIRGLCEAMKTHSLREGTIITESESGMEVIGDTIIHILPIDEWLESTASRSSGARRE